MVTRRALHRDGRRRSGGWCSGAAAARDDAGHAGCGSAASGSRRCQPQPHARVRTRTTARPQPHAAMSCRDGDGELSIEVHLLARFTFHCRLATAPRPAPQGRGILDHSSIHQTYFYGITHRRPDSRIPRCGARTASTSCSSQPRRHPSSILQRLQSGWKGWQRLEEVELKRQADRQLFGMVTKARLLRTPPSIRRNSEIRAAREALAPTPCCRFRFTTGGGGRRTFLC